MKVSLMKSCVPFRVCFMFPVTPKVRLVAFVAELSILILYWAPRLKKRPPKEESTVVLALLEGNSLLVNARLVAASLFPKR
jgi:hypothetical protein